jgi:hypothetical protein
MHRKAVRKSIELNVSLNEIIVRSLDIFLNGAHSVNHVTNYIVQEGKPRFTTVSLVASDAKPSWLNLSSGGVEARRGN